MSTVTSVSVSAAKPTVSANNGVKTSGSSTGSFSFLGQTTDARGNLIVVVQSTGNCDGSKCSVNASSNGGIFPAGSTGVYCIMNTNSTDTNNWTVRARTDKDGAGTGITFVSGTGGGGGK